MNELKISLAAARINAKMTQEKVAETLKVSKTTVVNWERSKTTPSAATLMALSNLYQIPIDNIFLPQNTT